MLRPPEPALPLSRGEAPRDARAQPACHARRRGLPDPRPPRPCAPLTEGQNLQTSALIIIIVIFWRARPRLYRNRFLQENMRFATFFKIYQII